MTAVRPFSWLESARVFNHRSNLIARMACEAAAEVRAPPFEVLFDRTVSFRGRPGNRPFVLLGDKGLDRLRSLRRTLGVAMAREGFRYLAKTDFTPHVTLLYVEEYPIDPICWTVNESSFTACMAMSILRGGRCVDDMRDTAEKKSWRLRAEPVWRRQSLPCKRSDEWQAPHRSGRVLRAIPALDGHP